MATHLPAATGRNPGRIDHRLVDPLGGFSMLMLLLLCLTPLNGPSGSAFCVSPWTYILVRAEDIEVGCLNGFLCSVVLACWRGEMSSFQRLLRHRQRAADTASSTAASMSPTAEFVSVN